jgi:hypothetical protein
MFVLDSVDNAMPRQFTLSSGNGESLNPDDSDGVEQRRPSSRRVIVKGCGTPDLNEDAASDDTTKSGKPTSSSHRLGVKKGGTGESDYSDEVHVWVRNGGYKKPSAFENDDLVDHQVIHPPDPS